MKKLKKGFIFLKINIKDVTKNGKNCIFKNKVIFQNAMIMKLILLICGYNLF